MHGWSGQIRFGPNLQYVGRSVDRFTALSSKQNAAVKSGRQQAARASACHVHHASLAAASVGITPPDSSLLYTSVPTPADPSHTHMHITGIASDWARRAALPLIDRARCVCCVVCCVDGRRLSRERSSDSSTWANGDSTPKPRHPRSAWIDCSGAAIFMRPLCLSGVVCSLPWWSNGSDARARAPFLVKCRGDLAGPWMLINQRHTQRTITLHRP